MFGRLTVSEAGELKYCLIAAIGGVEEDLCPYGKIFPEDTGSNEGC